MQLSNTTIIQKEVHVHVRYMLLHTNSHRVDITSAESRIENKHLCIHEKSSLKQAYTYMHSYVMFTQNTQRYR